MRAAFFALLVVMVSAASARADSFTLRYAGFGLGFIPVGDVVIDADVAADSYQVSTTLQSRGIFNLFERTNIQASASGVIQNGRVIWRRYDLDHHYSQKHRTISMQAADDGAVSAEITPNYRLWGHPATSDEQRRGSRDPVSTMVAMAIDIGQSHRCAGSYPTFDGRFHYALELGGGQIVHFNDAGYDGPVLKCSLAYRAIAGFEAHDAGRRRIPHGEVWFALMPDTTFAPVVRISTPLSAGGAVIRLTRFYRVHVTIEDDQTPVIAQ
jgi:hypothetical protein